MATEHLPLRSPRTQSCAFFWQANVQHQPRFTRKARSDSPENSLFTFRISTQSAGEASAACTCSALISSAARRKGLYIGGAQGVATDAPISTFHLLDHDLCNLTHVFAFDRHHSVGELANYFLLLIGSKYSFNEFHVYQWHCFFPSF